jgi:hypothetical protein
VLAFRVGETALQRWVSEPLRITSIPSGPFKDANLFVIYMDKLVKLDAEGKPSEGGNDRAVVFAAVAKRPQDEKPNAYVIRILTANPKAHPGAYKNSVLASVRREQALKMVNLEPGTEEQQWDVRDSAAGAIEFRLRCLRGLPTPGKVEQNVHSAVDRQGSRSCLTETHNWSASPSCRGIRGKYSCHSRVPDGDQLDRLIVVRIMYIM